MDEIALALTGVLTTAGITAVSTAVLTAKINKIMIKNTIERVEKLEKDVDQLDKRVTYVEAVVGRN